MSNIEKVYSIFVLDKNFSFPKAEDKNSNNFKELLSFKITCVVDQASLILINLL